MKTSNKLRRIICFMVILATLIGWGEISHKITKAHFIQYNGASASKATAQNAKQKSLYYKYYMILKSRSKMHKV